MRINNLITKLAGVFVLMALMVGCSDDSTFEGAAGEYGFVQFKLLKKGMLAESGNNAATRAGDADVLDSLAYAKKLKITLKSEFDVLEQTLELSAVNNEQTEEGLYSEKCRVLAGNYRVAGYELLDNLNRTILTYDQESEAFFEVLAGGLTVQPIGVNVRPRGLVKFQVVKDLSQITTRAEECYRLDKVEKMDVTLHHQQTGELRRIEGLRTKIEFFYGEEGENFIQSKLNCDSLVSLKAGDYTVTSFILYDKDKKTLEAAKVATESHFTVADNKTTIADVPVTLRPTAGNILDGIVLKKIWEALDGPNWSYRGIRYAKGTNWNFDRDIDLWTAQPSVQVLEDGRVATISLGGFGAKGDMPEALGELTKLRSLMIGLHDDGMGNSPIGQAPVDEIEEAARADWKMISNANYSLAQMAPEMREVFPDSLQIKIKQVEDNKGRSAKALDTYANVPENFSSYVTSLPKSIGKLQELKSLFIANCPIATLPNELAQCKNCTDVELYNCPNMKSIPTGVMNLPKLQMTYFVNNNGISADQLYEDMKTWAASPGGKSLQGLYFMNNNLEVVPDLRGMEKLGFWDADNNNIRKFEAPFGKDHNFINLNLANNELTELPRDEFGYFANYESAETWSFAGNKFTEVPNVFTTDLLFATLDFSQNLISGFEDGENFRGVVAEILNLSFNRFEKFPKDFYGSKSRCNYLQLRGCGIRDFEEGALDGKYAYMTSAIDLAGNRLKKLPNEFGGHVFNYLGGLDLTGNAFEEFAWRALNCYSLQTLIFRGQRNDEGYRCMREWPVGLYSHPGLRSVYIGSNDIRKVTDGSLSRLNNLFIELCDNPNISIDLTEACPNIMRGVVYFMFDKGQDVRGCDAIVPKY